MSYTLVTNFYNEADKIEDCMKSIAQQTLQPVGWILINDGSTDNSDKIARRECLKHEIECFGYFNGLRSDWRCNDPDVRYASSLRFGMRRLWRRVRI